MTTPPADETFLADDTVALALPEQPIPAPPPQSLAEKTLDEVDRLWDSLSASSAPPASPLDFELPAGFKLSVVIPVYNERGTIREVIARVRELPLQTEIIVVDDCSTDGTAEWLRTLEGAPGLRLIFKPVNEGKGAALRAGFAEATGDVVVVQDADLEYDPRDLPQLLQPIVSGEADVVYGSRFLGEELRDKSWLHRLVNRVLTGASNLFTGLRLTDMETCYKVFRRQVIQGLPLHQSRFGFEPEVTARLARLGCRVVERPVGYHARGYAEGKKIGVADAFNALYCVVRYSLAD